MDITPIRGEADYERALHRVEELWDSREGSRESDELDILTTLIEATMSELARSGTAIILVTHELADIVPEIQRVVLMSRGRVVADGTKEEILQVERLAALFGVSVEMARRNGHYHLW